MDNTASDPTGIRQHWSSADPTITEFRSILSMCDEACSSSSTSRRGAVVVVEVVVAVPVRIVVV
eukprot:6882119-Pyramimonas_sp.AAC.1